MATLTAALEAGRRRVGPRAALAALLTLAFLAALGYVGSSRLLAPAAAPPVSGQPARVQRGSVAATVSTTGSVVSSRSSKLAMQAAGKLVELPVKLGDAVTAGQVLARLDATPLLLKVKDAENNLQTAQLKLDQLAAGSRPEEVAQAEAAVASAQARLADVRSGSTAQDLAAQQAAVDGAAAGVRSAQARLDQVRAGATAADRSSAQNQLAAAQASLRKAELALATLQAGARPEDVRAAELAVEQARNSLWSQQISRDSTCGRSRGGPCDSANASVAAAESAVSQANEKLKAIKNPPDPKDVAQRQADVDAASDAVRNARVKLDQLEASPTPEELRQAQASLESAQSGYTQAVARLDALKQGAKAGDLAAAQTALVQAQAQLAIRKSPNTPQELRLAELQVRAAQVALEVARLDAGNATLVAPYDGVVGAIAANVGEQVGAATAVITLVDTRRTRVDVSVDESDIAKIAPGKTAQISFDALPDRRFTGEVIGIAPSATVTQGVATYTVQVSIDSADQAVPVGLTANVNVVTARKDDTLFVPNRAVRRNGRNQVVDVLVDGRAQPRNVTTGLANDTVTEITQGVQEGETVLIPATTTQQPRVGGFGGPPVGR